MKVYIKYSIAALLTQLGLWTFFSLADWAFDEHDIFESSIINDGILWLVMITMIVVPFTLYIKTRKKYFYHKNYVVDDIFHIIVHIITATIVSYPLLDMVNYGHWIVDQKHNRGSFIDLNGIEYVFIPIIQGIIALLMLIALICDVVKHVQSREEIN